MEFAILGALRVRPQVTLPPKAQLLLAVLLCEPGTPISVDRLADALWNGVPPTSAVQNVRSYVHQLRRALGDDRVVRHAAGYAIVVHPGELDTQRFEELAASGRFREALALWRGPALDGFDFLSGEQARLEERRLAVLGESFEAELAAGRHADAVPELTRLVKEHPLNERFSAQLMLALHRSGRRAAALSVYREIRTEFVTELGLEPGRELRELEGAILAGEGALSDVPAELPADIADFTGRSDTVARMVESMGGLLAINGRPGVGKSTLAVRVAQRAAAAFPDGQLFAVLKDADPRWVLARFLRALGVDGTAIPDGLDERAALFRSRLAGRRVLVVLDDAADERQVRPLLPGSAGCAVLITSRRRLSGLEGAAHEDVAEFEPGWAVALFASIAGGPRVAAEPEVAAEIVRLCGYLPLAVRIAAARLAARPQWTLARFARLLSDERNRLSQLAVGDLEVRASLALSYEGLSEPERTAFRLLGLLELPTIPAVVAAAVAGETEVEALVDARLLDELPGERYRLHDLTRLYASELGTPDNAVLERGFQALLAMAERADAGMPSHVMEPVPDRPRVEPIDGALEWFDAERTTLVAAVTQAATAGLAGLAWRLCGAMVDYLDFHNLYDDWDRTHQVTLDACRSAGDRLGEAVTLRGLAYFLIIGPQQEEGSELAERARAIFAELGEVEADTLHLTGTLHRMRGQIRPARDDLTAAVDVSAANGLAITEAAALWELGLLSIYEGRLEEAIAVFERQRDVASGPGMIRQQAIALRGLGMAHCRTGDFAEAESYLRAGLALLRDVGDPLSEVHLDISLGEVYAVQGDPRARPLLERSLSLVRAANHNHACAAQALLELGILAVNQSEYGEAVTRLREALDLFGKPSMPYYEARTLRALGDAYAGLGDQGAAEQAWEAERKLRARLR